MPDFATSIGAMIGLGVGIDYALFIVTRYRESCTRRANRRGRAGDRPRHRRPGRPVRRHHRRGLAARHAAHRSRRSCRARDRRRGHGRRHHGGVDHPAAGSARPRRRPLELTRWRGLIAAGLVALALLGRSGLGIPPLAIGALARRGRPAGRLVRRRPLRREVPAARAPSRCARPSGYRWSRVDPGPPVAVGSSAAPSCCCRWPSRCSACGWASPTRATSPRTTTRAGLRPARRGLRPRRSTARSSSPPASTIRPDAGAVARPSPTPWRPTPAWPAPRRPVDPTIPEAPEAFVIQVIPTTSPQDEATDELVAPPPRRRHARASAGTDARWPTSPAPWPASIDFTATCRPSMPLFFGAGPGAVVPVADDGVPLAAGAAQGRDHEHAVDRRGLRRGRRHLPVGLVRVDLRHRTAPRSSRSSR